MFKKLIYISCWVLHLQFKQNLSLVSHSVYFIRYERVTRSRVIKIVINWKEKVPPEFWEAVSFICLTALLLVSDICEILLFLILILFAPISFSLIAKSLINFFLLSKLDLFKTQTSSGLSYYDFKKLPFNILTCVFQGVFYICLFFLKKMCVGTVTSRIHGYCGHSRNSGSYKLIMLGRCPYISVYWTIPHTKEMVCIIIQ